MKNYYYFLLYEVIQFNIYTWNEKKVDLYPDEIAPWKLPRNRHATISVLKHRNEDLQAVDNYLTDCEPRFSMEYLKRMTGTAEQAWHCALQHLNAALFPRGKNIVLECLQFGGNREFWDGFQYTNEIRAYFQVCFEYAIQTIGYLKMHENILCAVIVAEPNRRNLFVYYLPVTECWQTKVMSLAKNKRGTKLQQRDEYGDPLYTTHTDIHRPRLSSTEFWKQRGGLTSFSDLQEDFYQHISKHYGAVRGQSTSLLKNTNPNQAFRFQRKAGDEFDELLPFDDCPCK